MEITLLIVIGVLVVTNATTVVFLTRKKKKGFESYSNLDLLSDLVNNHKSLIEIKRIAPGEVFLRSPRDVT